MPVLVIVMKEGAVDQGVIVETVSLTLLQIDQLPHILKVEQMGSYIYIHSSSFRSPHSSLSGQGARPRGRCY